MPPSELSHASSDPARTDTTPHHHRTGMTGPTPTGSASTGAGGGEGANGERRPRPKWLLALATLLAVALAAIGIALAVVYSRGESDKVRAEVLMHVLAG